MINIVFETLKWFLFFGSGAAGIGRGEEPTGVLGG